MFQMLLNQPNSTCASARHVVFIKNSNPRCAATMPTFAYQHNRSGAVLVERGRFLGILEAVYLAKKKFATQTVPNA